MFLQKKISADKLTFQKICKDNGVEYLYAFGSSIVNDYNDESDVDLLVKLKESDPIIKGNSLIKLWDSFENFFNKKVDLLTDYPIANPYLKNNIDRHKLLIYDRTGIKISD